MKNMVYCFLCNLLLVALIILTSCARQDDVEPGRAMVEIGRDSSVRPGGKTGFLLCHPPMRLYSESVSIRFNAVKKSDSLSASEKMSDMSRRDLMHWSGYSSLGSNP